jgi:hypothetical protein
MKYLKSWHEKALMVSHCANPACRVPLRRLRDGRLFQFEVRPQSVKEPTSGFAKVSRTITHFWLCGECSSKLTLVFDQFQAVVLKPAVAA